MGGYKNEGDIRSGESKRGMYLNRKSSCNINEYYVPGKNLHLHIWTKPKRKSSNQFLIEPNRTYISYFENKNDAMQVKYYYTE